MDSYPSTMAWLCVCVCGHTHTHNLSSSLSSHTSWNISKSPPLDLVLQLFSWSMRTFGFSHNDGAVFGSMWEKVNDLSDWWLEMQQRTINCWLSFLCRPPSAFTLWSHDIDWILTYLCGVQRVHNHMNTIMILLPLHGLSAHFFTAYIIQ